MIQKPTFEKSKKETDLLINPFFYLTIMKKKLMERMGKGISQKRGRKEQFD
jgi:hypothetical protein